MYLIYDQTETVLLYKIPSTQYAQAVYVAEQLALLRKERIMIFFNNDLIKTIY